MSRSQEHLQRGQALIEFLVIFWFAFSFLMLVMQISLMFNAHSMLKLAAYNAARAAIVARDDKKPERPVKLKDMREAARKAAFLTILPVIPGMHAQISETDDVLKLIGKLPAGVGSLGLGTIKGHGKGVFAAAVEYLGFGVDFTNGRQDFFDVKFVSPTGDPNAKDAEIKSIPHSIEFDDTSKNALNDPNGNNLIKVVVTWYYPLVIPLADQIIYAYTHTADLVMGYGVTSPQAAEIGLGQYKRRPVWEVGWVFRSDGSHASSFTGFRVPLRTSYVMRMQWDRGPS